MLYLLFILWFIFQNVPEVIESIFSTKIHLNTYEIDRIWFIIFQINMQINLTKSKSISSKTYCMTQNTSRHFSSNTITWNTLKHLYLEQYNNFQVVKFRTALQIFQYLQMEGYYSKRTFYIDRESVEIYEPLLYLTNVPGKIHENH